jgi:hypothetical protein
MNIHPGLAGLFVGGTDCTTWRRVASSWRVGGVLALVGWIYRFSLVLWEQ